MNETGKTTRIRILSEYLESECRNNKAELARRAGEHPARHSYHPTTFLIGQLQAQHIRHEKNNHHTGIIRVDEE